MLINFLFIFLYAQPATVNISKFENDDYDDDDGSTHGLFIKDVYNPAVIFLWKLISIADIMFNINLMMKLKKVIPIIEIKEEKRYPEAQVYCSSQMSKGTNVFESLFLQVHSYIFCRMGTCYS